MIGENSFLALFLDAPLQSWGYKSKFDYRTSAAYPTRSAVIGMFCAALGVDRRNETRLADLHELKMTVYIFYPSPRLVDYHTVGGGWDKRKYPMNVVRKADGKPGNTVVTHREYLMDTKFGIVIYTHSSLAEELAQALRYPEWGVWLGRKSCIPATPIVQGIFEGQTAAVERLSELAGCSPFRAVVEVENFEEGTDTIQDSPMSFHDREFAPRRIALQEKDEIADI